MGYWTFYHHFCPRKWFVLVQWYRCPIVAVNLITQPTSVDLKLRTNMIVSSVCRIGNFQRPSVSRGAGQGGTTISRDALVGLDNGGLYLICSTGPYLVWLLCLFRWTINLHSLTSVPASLTFGDPSWSRTKGFIFSCNSTCQLERAKLQKKIWTDNRSYASIISQNQGDSSSSTSVVLVLHEIHVSDENRAHFLCYTKNKGQRKLTIWQTSSRSASLMAEIDFARTCDSS